TRTDAEKYEPIPAPVEVEQGGTVNPDDTIANLEDLPEGTTVTLPEDFSTDEVGSQVVDVTVTYPDDSTDTVEVEVTIVDPNDGKTDAEKYEPIPAPVEVEVGGTVVPEETIENLDELPEGTTVTVPDVDTTKPGTTVVDVTVTYPDDSTDTVEVEVTIVDPNDGKTDAEKYEPKPNPVEVETGGTLNPDDTVGNLDELPDGTTVTVVEEVDTSKPGTHEVTVVVTYPDGSTDSFTTTVTVKDPAAPAPSPSTPGTGGKLPITGANTTGLAIASVFAILGGLAAAAYAQRRKES
ncbi:MAG: Rib/alpha-like domain-containing protein, partial [Bowdeniella nasicola]|nr:Rib/alpha-like domain-containing protein [Bowdeniella nasicola]